MTPVQTTHSIDLRRLRTAEPGAPTRPTLPPSVRRALEGPHRVDPDRYPRWG